MRSFDGGELVPTLPYWAEVHAMPESKRLGDAELDALLEKLRRIEDGTYREDGKWPDPERVALYGGISGIVIDVPEFLICDGLVVRETFAHVMAPYIMAFAKPSKRGAPHPPPWKAASGGLGFDVTIEVALAQSVRPISLDRINTLWWVLALLRLRTAAPLRMPVMSDIPFAAVVSSKSEPHLWTIEMPPRQIRLAQKATDRISSADLIWVRDHFQSGAALLSVESFNRALQTFDTAIWAHGLGSAVIMAWTALETMFRPGRTSITKRLGQCVATYLYPAGSERDRCFNEATILYEARGSVTHDAQSPDVEHFFDTFDLARRCFIKCIEAGHLPDADTLIGEWKRRA